MTKEVKVSELELGDVIRLETVTYPDAIVTQIKDERVYLRRPYMVTANFSYTGGVITYIGTEDWSMSFNSPPVILKEKGPKLK